jgi:uncharacterized protein (TIGR03435 family)
LAAIGFVTAVMLAQAPSKRPRFDEFEVASIKPAADIQGRWIRMQTTHQFAARNHGITTLIAAAYNQSPRAIFGTPAALDKDRFDILAKAPNEIRPNLEEQMAMLRKLLADRFKLTFHHETRELSYYALRLAKSGSKLKESTVLPDALPEGPPPLIFVLAPQSARLPGRYATMVELASVMQRAALDHPVVDKTGLAGRYDFDLEWAPDESQFGGALGKNSDDSTKPDLFKALEEQLGLKLEAAKGPVEVFVIDHVERPTEN